MTDPIETLAEERISEVPETKTAKGRSAPPAGHGKRAMPVTLDRHPGFRRHPMGHHVDAPSVMRPAVFTEWDAIVGNGGGLVNCAAWARRIEAEGIGTGFAGGFLRGLIHR